MSTSFGSLLENRVDFVTRFCRTHRHDDQLRDLLLGSDRFRIPAAMGYDQASAWRALLDGLVKSGYMRHTRSGHYAWNKLVCHVRTAGPGAVQWLVTDSLAKTGSRPLAGGHVGMPADHTSDELNAACAEAETRAHSARQQLEAKAA